MGRKVRDAQLDNRNSREKLTPRGKPHYRMIDPELHLGYRRLRGRPGTWVVRIYRGGRKYDTKVIATADDFSEANGAGVLDFTQAQNEARRLRDERSRSAAGITGPYTVGNALDAYLTYLKDAGRADQSIRDIRYRIEASIRPDLGAEKIADLTAEHLRRWRKLLSDAPPRWRSGKGKQQQYRKVVSIRARQATANRIATVLKAALNHAVKEKKVEVSEAWVWGDGFPPFKGVDAERPRFLTLPEAKRLINGADRASGFRDLVRAALLTGCRYGELCALRVRHFKHGKLHIARSKTGKARDVALTDEGKAFFTALTTGRRDGDVMLMNRGRLARAAEAERKHIEKGNAPREVAPDDGAWRKSEQTRPMAEACKAARIDPMGFHQLRHTYASLSVMNDVPLLVVARNLGHIDTRMVEKHYGHLTETYLDKAIREGAPQFGFKPDRKVINIGARR